MSKSILTNYINFVNFDGHGADEEPTLRRDCSGYPLAFFKKIVHDCTDFLAFFLKEVILWQYPEVKLQKLGPAAGSQ